MTKKNVILLADDDLFVRKLLRRALEGVAELVEVSTGMDAIEKHQEIAPDMVILDYHLPDMNGPEVLKILLTSNPNAFIVMISGDSVEQNIVQTRAQGAKGFICKPFRHDVLMRYIKMCPTMELPSNV